MESCANEARVFRSDWHWFSSLLCKNIQWRTNGIIGFRFRQAVLQNERTTGSLWGLNTYNEPVRLRVRFRVRLGTWTGYKKLQRSLQSYRSRAKFKRLIIKANGQTWISGMVSGDMSSKLMLSPFILQSFWLSWSWTSCVKPGKKRKISITISVQNQPFLRNWHMMYFLFRSKFNMILGANANSASKNYARVVDNFTRKINNLVSLS